MTNWIQYRLMQAGEEKDIYALVKRVFHEFVAHQYSSQGIQEFLNYIEPQCLSKRCQEDGFVLLSETKEQIVGMIELIGNSHISLFYVEGHLQRIGVGRALLRKSLNICRKNNPSLSEITVNSSPNAVSIYEKFRFSKVEPEKEKNGIRFVPMKLEFPNALDT